MCRNAMISSLLLVAGVLCLTAWADDQSSPPKSGNSDGITQPDQARPGRPAAGKGMMGGPMKERGMKMMKMHQKMQEEMKVMDAMATLITRLVAQRKMMVEKMGAMHADMMQMMMEGAGTAHKPAVTDEKETAHDHSAAGHESGQKQHQP